MLRYLVAGLCGLSLTGSVYMAGWGSMCRSSSTEAADCCMTSEAALSLPAGVVEVKNTKCIVMGDDVGTSTNFVTYQGKAYHICCKDCIEAFNKEPEKYVKALDAAPAKFGVSLASD
ncbi:MAG TPA: YHS domain-containing protein [Phycisphaerae bacterium]